MLSVLHQRFVVEVSTHRHPGPFIVVAVAEDGPVNAHGPFPTVMEALQASVDWDQELNDPSIELRVLNLHE